MKNKLLIILLALVLVFTLAACGDDEPLDGPGMENVTATDTEGEDGNTVDTSNWFWPTNDDVTYETVIPQLRADVNLEGHENLAVISKMTTWGDPADVTTIYVNAQSDINQGVMKYYSNISDDESYQRWVNYDGQSDYSIYDGVKYHTIYQNVKPCVDETAMIAFDYPEETYYCQLTDSELTADNQYAVHLKAEYNDELTAEGTYYFDGETGMLKSFSEVYYDTSSPKGDGTYDIFMTFDGEVIQDYDGDFVIDPNSFIEDTNFISICYDGDTYFAYCDKDAMVTFVAENPKGDGVLSYQLYKDKECKKKFGEKTYSYADLGVVDKDLELYCKTKWHEAYPEYAD